MKTLILFAAAICCLPVSSAQQANKSQDMTSFVTVDQLKGVLASIDKAAQDSATKAKMKTYAWEQWTRNRAMAEAEYSDNLDQAADIWYANNGDFKKIPQPLWDKLRELDKYEFKHALPGKEVLSTERNSTTRSVRMP